MGLFSRTLSRLDELKRALTRDPASHQFLALADEHRRQGQVAEAIDVLEKGLAQAPSSVAGHVALGRLLRQTGRGESAIAAYQAALRLDPQNLVALRQTADLYLAKGDKVEAIKKLKLYRGLNPGDRDVNDLIRQLDEELSAMAAPRPPSRFPTGAVAPLPPEATAFPPPLPPGPFGAVAAPPPGAPAPPPPPVEDAVAAGAPEAPESALPEEVSAPPPGVASAESRAPAGPPESPFGDFGFTSFPGPTDAGGQEGLEPFPPARSPEPEPAPTLPVELPARVDVEPAARAEARPAQVAEPPHVPGATETLAELLRVQGHLGQAEETYRALAASEPDPDRAQRFSAIAAELGAARDRTPRGRLESWVAPFTRALGRRESDLVGLVEEVVRRVGPSSAVVTDLEGVPVVNIGPPMDEEAMESLSAELTAFWKNARRSRAEVGEGALDGLVLSCSAGTAVVKVITPSYALIVRVGNGIPAGRLRFEAARAAELLRPALL